jgi:hypothetical protein
LVEVEVGVKVFKSAKAPVEVALEALHTFRV